MLAVLFWGLSSLAVIYIVLGVAFLLMAGKLVWTPDISRSAKLGWPVMVLISAVITVLVSGPVILMTIWVYYVAAIVIPFTLFIVLDLINGSGLAKAHIPPNRSSTQNWDTLWRSYEGKALPPWMVQAAMQGEVRYDGKVARIVNGVLVPTTSPSPLSMERLFKRLDDLLG